MVRPRLVLLIVAIAGAPAPAEGQSDSSASQVAAIAGTVSDAATHEPLADVRIQLEGTKLGALSGIDGRYRPTAVRPGAHALSVRGASSMTLMSEPLVYIDGVRVNNAAADGGSVPGVGSVGVDSRYPPSRINDLNPDEIASIEMIKGPAAATLYGTEASNGVINIITKRGSRGRPTVSFQVKQGANWLPDPENFFQHSYYKSAAGE